MPDHGPFTCACLKSVGFQRFGLCNRIFATGFQPVMMLRGAAPRILLVVTHYLRLRRALPDQSKRKSHGRHGEGHRLGRNLRRGRSSFQRSHSCWYLAGHCAPCTSVRSLRPIICARMSRTSYGSAPASSGVLPRLCCGVSCGLGVKHQEKKSRDPTKRHTGQKERPLRWLECTQPSLAHDVRHHCRYALHFCLHGKRDFVEIVSTPMP